jgi:hypothetical protein
MSTSRKRSRRSFSSSTDAAAHARIVARNAAGLSRFRGVTSRSNVQGERAAVKAAGAAGDA